MAHKLQKNIVSKEVGREICAREWHAGFVWNFFFAYLFRRRKERGEKKLSEKKTSEEKKIAEQGNKRRP